MQLREMPKFCALVRKNHGDRSASAYAKFLRISRQQLTSIQRRTGQIYHETVMTVLNRLGVCYCAICESRCSQCRLIPKPGNPI